MLKIQGTYVTFCEDVCGNKGGYYCQVYDSEDMDNEVDNFVIHAAELAGLSGRAREAKAEEIAANYVKFNLKGLRRQR